MKIRLFFLFLGLMAPLFSTLVAQEGWGLRNVVGGQFNLYYVKGADYGYNNVVNPGNKDRIGRNWGVSPYAAWKISHRSLLGGRVGYQNYYDQIPYYNANGNTYEAFSQSLSAGVFTRHYLKPESRLGFFAEPSFQFSHSDEKQRLDGGDYANKIKTNEFRLTASLGVSYQLSQRLGLLVRGGQIGGSTSKSMFTDKKDTRSSEFQFNFNFTSFFWGLEWRWGGESGKE